MELKGPQMKITEIKENKKQYMSLLLLADEQENMIDRYIDKGTMYVLYDNGVKANVLLQMRVTVLLRLRTLRPLPNTKAKVMQKP